MMKAYTIECPGRVVPGVACVERGGEGAVVVGLRPNRTDEACVSVEAGARVVAGRLEWLPGDGAALLILDQGGSGGSWHIRAAHPPERWDAMLAAESLPSILDRILAAERVHARFPHVEPAGWHFIARGLRGEADPLGRSPANLYGHLDEGAALEIRRRGRLQGTPDAFRVECRGGDVVVTDPRALAVARRDALAPAPRR